MEFHLFAHNISQWTCLLELTLCIFKNFTAFNRTVYHLLTTITSDTMYFNCKCMTLFNFFRKQCDAHSFFKTLLNGFKWSTSIISNKFAYWKWILEFHPCFYCLFVRFTVGKVQLFIIFVFYFNYISDKLRQSRTIK